MKSLLVLTLALLSLLNDSVHGAKCACEAQKHNFTIDCDDTANNNNNKNNNKNNRNTVTRMMDAFVYLQTNGCSSDCSSKLCEKNFMIVQSHYDHCPEDGSLIPSDMETSIHNFEAQCESCDIVRQEIVGSSICPEINCEDGSGSAAYNRLLTKGCNEQFKCTETNCKDDWLTLKMVHDTCGSDVLRTEAGAEDGGESIPEAFEEPCKAFQCNLPLETIAKTLECSVEDLLSDGDFDHDHNNHDHDQDESSVQMAPTMTPAATTTPATYSGVARYSFGSIVALVVTAVAALF